MRWRPMLLAFASAALLGLLLSGFLRPQPIAGDADRQPPARVEQPADPEDGNPPASEPGRTKQDPARPGRDLKARRIVALALTPAHGLRLTA
jgi:hypothetical protein